MDVAYLRQEIIHITKTNILKKGIKSMKMNDIAAEAGMSKRTLYQLFDTKDELFRHCIQEIQKDYREKILLVLENIKEAPVESLLSLHKEFIKSNYCVNYNFTLDMKNRREYREYYEENKLFWVNVYERSLERCYSLQYLIQDIDIKFFAREIVSWIDNARIQEVPPNTQEQFCTLIF